MKVVIIIQARMSSSRLPGKVLKPIIGRPMLSYQLERLRQVKRADQLVIATTTLFADDPIISVCSGEGVPFIRGSEDDVLSRYDKAATQFNAGVVVRVTSDCPLIDPELIDEAIATFLHPPMHYDYVSNMLVPTYPYGMAIEVMAARVLQEAQIEATDAAEREHVTPFIYWRPERYRLKSLTMQPDLSHHRWTVDTPEDFQLVSRIIENLYPCNPKFHMNDVLNLLANHPDWTTINRHVQQKAVAFFGSRA